MCSIQLQSLNSQTGWFSIISWGPFYLFSPRIVQVEVKWWNASSRVVTIWLWDLVQMLSWTVLSWRGTSFARTCNHVAHAVYRETWLNLMSNVAGEPKWHALEKQTDNDGKTTHCTFYISNNLFMYNTNVYKCM